MLSPEDNRLLTRVGPGTPMGELLRRFWLPVLTREELARPDGPPLRVRVLNEDLVAFRDTDGRVGVVDAHCAHRRAPLFFGRNEACGLRCAYHGWKFDVEGRCVDMPSEPSESTFKDRVRLKSYPTREWGGLIWVYMGPADRLPQLPQLEWARVPDSHRVVSRTLHESSYLQGLEGEMDTGHISFLHRWFDDAFSYKGAVTASTARDPAPRLTVKETDYGFVYGGRRNDEHGQYLWRVTHWLVPTHAVIPYVSWPRGDKTWVPIDDEHSHAFAIYYHRDRPLTEAEIRDFHAGLVNSPRLERTSFRLKDGRFIDTWRSTANRDHDYWIDREVQATRNFTGIAHIADQDRCMTEGMGPIVDRSQEHLGTTDVAIIAARRRLLRMMKELQQGEEPYAAQHGDLYTVRSMVVVTPDAEFEKVLEAYSAEIGVPA